MHHLANNDETLIPLSEYTKALDANDEMKENNDSRRHTNGHCEKQLVNNILHGNHLTPSRKRNSDCDTLDQVGQRNSNVTNTSEERSLQEVRSKMAKYQLSKDENELDESQTVPPKDGTERDRPPLQQSAARKSFVKLSLKNSKKNIENEEKSSEFTFEDMLKSKAALNAFRDFLKSEYSEENLDFWLECEQYKGLKGAKQERTAIKIFAQYMSRTALREINVDSAIRSRTEERLKRPDKECFVEAQNCIYALMRSDPFRRFTASEKYQKLSESHEGFKLSLKRTSTKKK